MNVIDDLLLRSICDGESDLERMTNQIGRHVIMINSDDQKIDEGKKKDV